MNIPMHSNYHIYFEMLFFGGVGVAHVRFPGPCSRHGCSSTALQFHFHKFSIMDEPDDLSYEQDDLSRPGTT